MRRWLLSPRVLASALVLSALALAGASNGCGELKIAGSDSGVDPSSVDGGDGVDGSTTSGADGGKDADATISPTVRPYYADVQAVLAAKRFAGPTTGTSANVHCTPSYFVWVDDQNAVHSWRGTTKARIDYGFPDNNLSDVPLPSDTFFTVQRPYVYLDVYRMDAVNALVTQLPYSENYATASNGVILLDQKIDSMDVGGTKVRRWNAATMMTEDITSVLSTRERPSSFVGDTLVIPGGKFAPYPIFIVDVVKKTWKTVTYSNASELNQAEASVDGLLVSYGNGTAGVALRLYMGNLDNASSRVELGQDIDARPAYFEDPPTNGQEHDFRGTFATFGKKVFFGTQYGIWSYDLATKAVVPVQLNAGKAPATPRFICVMRDAGLLVYQMDNDLTTQVWAVPLASLPP